MAVAHVVAFAALLFAATAQQNGVSLGEFSSLAHDLGGNVFAIDSRTFEVRNFNYDGTGPAAFFWVGTGNTPSRNGFAIPFAPTCDAGVKLGPYTAATSQPIRVEMPEGMTINDVDYLSVWCEVATQNFGHVLISDAAKARIPNASGARLCAAEPTFPVQQGWNCENLVTGYQVRWKRDGANLDFELVAKITPQQWVSFGVSGSQTSTSMDNADVVIATEVNGEPTVVDYFLDSRGQCSGGVGVCPDTVSTSGRGENDITKVSGKRTLDTLVVRYTRPIAANEPTDRPFFVEQGRETYVIWATGPYNAQLNLPQVHLRDEMSIARGNVLFDFGRAPADNCKMPIVASKPEEKKVLVPWDRPTMSGVTDFTARIGPSGGNKGVEAITQADSWGIAWYMSETGTTGKDVLIPAIAVERGKTYTFRIFGGNDRSKKAAFHPMYITSDSEGGFADKGPRGRMEEKVHAGIQVTEQNSTGIYNFTFDAVGPLCEYKQPQSVVPTEIGTYDAYFKSLDRSCAQSVPAEEAGVLTWTVPQNFSENLVYYHCATHRDLGFRLVVFDEGKVDQAVLKANSVVAAPQEGGKQVCKDTFNGMEVTYSGCRTTGGGKMRVLWRINGDSIETMFVGKTEGYAGLGWGHSKMVPGNAVIAYADAQGAVQVGDFALSSRSSAGVTASTNQSITNTAGELRNGEIAAMFTRPLAGSGSVQTLDPTGDASFIYAIGGAPQAGPVFSIHTERGSETVNLAASGASAGAAGFNRSAYFVAHAVMMGLAWALLTPMAIVIMRFFKKLNPTTFQLHRGMNSLSVLLTVVAFIMGVIRGSHTSKAHLSIGVIVTAFALSQGINGALRPGKGTPNRSKWFWAHMGSGYAAYVLAVANLAIGWKLLGSTVNIRGLWWLLFTVPLVLIALAAVGLSFFPSMFPITEKEDGSAGNMLAENEVM